MEWKGREEDKAKKRGTEWSTRELNGMVWKGRWEGKPQVNGMEMEGRERNDVK